MTEITLAAYCSKLGYDVERVVDLLELGPASADSEIAAYTGREDRLLVTYDDDFLAEHDALARTGELFGIDERLTPFETANIVDAVDRYLDQEWIVAMDDTVHLTADWT